MSNLDVVKLITKKDALSLVGCIVSESLNENKVKELLEENFLNIHIALKYMGNLKNYNSIDKFLKLADLGIISAYRIIEYEPEILLLKSELDNFLERHFNLGQALEKYQLKNRNFFTSKNKSEIDKGNSPPFSILRINNQKEGVFLNKKELEDYMNAQAIKNNNYYNQKEAANIMGLNKERLVIVLEEYNIKLTNNGKIFKEDVDYLIKEQKNSLKDIEENYYPTKELIQIMGRIKLSMAARTNIARKKIPNIARTNKGKYELKSNNATTSLLYNKEEIDEWLRQKRSYEYKNNTPSEDPFVTFKGTLEISKMKFSETSKITEELWFKYVHTKLSKMAGDKNNKRNRLTVFIGATNIIISTINGREISEMSENQLNISIFNTNYPKAQRSEIFKFIKGMNTVFIKYNQSSHWNIRKLKDPNKAPKKSVSKTIYSIEEYLNLTDYIQDVHLHLKNAIKDIEANQTENTSYNHYASVWLYILVHLNNGWRHSDVLRIPRINLSKTSLEGKDLNWLKYNQLTEKDIKNIVSQMKSKKLFHSKTQRKRYFFCSDELSVAFAYAIAICELRNMEYNPLSSQSIDCNSSSFPNDRQMNIFFSSYKEPSFKFRSLKMNRTVLSYIYTVSRGITNRNPMEFAKVLRNHTNDDVTNIYIDIPKEYVNRITKALFNLGNFGYTYTILRELLVANKDSGLLNTEKALSLKKVIGSVSNVEKVASHIRFLDGKQKEKNILRQYLSELSLEEIEAIYQEINIGMRPGKQEYINCIFEECKFKNKECHTCVYAIHNLYGLSVLGNRLSEKVEAFDTALINARTEGTKNKIINSIYEDLSLLSIAIEKFGEDTVSPFLSNTSLEELRQLWSEKKQILVMEGE